MQSPGLALMSMHAGKLEKLKLPGSKWEKYWFETNETSLFFFTLLVGKKGFKKGSYTLTRYSSIDVEVHETGYRMSDASISGIPGLSAMTESNKNSEYSYSGVDLPRPTNPPNMINRRPSLSKSLHTMLMGGSTTDSIGLSTTSSAASRSKYPGSKFLHQFSIKNVINDADNSMIDEIILSSDSLDDKYKWIDSMNKIILSDSYRFLLNTYSLGDLFSKFNVVSEFSVELRFKSDFSESVVPATQFSDTAGIISMKALDVDKPVLNFLSAQNGSLGLYDAQSAHMGFYTIVIANYDAWPPGSLNLIGSKKDQIFIQWAVVNSTVLFDQSFSTHNALCDYIPPCPIAGSGINRILVLIFQQPDFVDKSSLKEMQESFKRRASGDLVELASLLSLGPLVAVNCFSTEWDPHVDVVRDRYASIFLSVEDGSQDDVEFLNGIVSFVHQLGGRKTGDSNGIGSGNEKSNFHEQIGQESVTNSIISADSKAVSDEAEAVNKVAQTYRAQLKLLTEEHAQEVITLQQLINSVQTALMEERQQHDAVAAKVDTLTLDIISLQGELASQQSKNHDLEVATHHYVSQIDALQSDISKIHINFEREREDYEQEITDYCDKIKSLQGKLETESEAKEMFQSTAFQYSTRIDELHALKEQEIQALTANILQLENELRNQANIASEQTVLVSERDEIISSLRNEIVVLKSSIQQGRNAELEIQKKLNEVETKLEDAIASLLGQESEFDRQRGEYEGEIKDLCAKIKLLQSNISSGNDSLQMSQSQQAEYISRIQQLQTQLSDEIAKNSSRENAFSSHSETLKQNVSHLEKKLQEKAAMVETLQQEIVRIQASEQVTLSTLSNLQLIVDDDEKKMQSLESEKEQQAIEYKTMEQVYVAQINSLNETLKTLRSSLSDEIESKEIYKSTAVEYGQQMKLLSTQYNTDVNALQSQIDELQTEMGSLVATVEADQESKERFAAESAEKDDIINMLVEEVEKLRLEVSNWRSSHIAPSHVQSLK